jgi:hypothetical protein
MQKEHEALFEAIRARCQRASWFGPDALKPELEALPRPDDPFIDEYASVAVASDDPNRSGFAFPPATEEQIRATETRLGFALPPLLRDLYLSLANGGFGPGTGLRGVEGGYKGAYHQYNDAPGARTYPPLFSYATYQVSATRAAARGERASMRVPCSERLEHLLPFCDLGDCEEAAVDSQGRMFLLSPTESNEFYNLEQLPWTLEGWLWRWIRSENLLEFHRSDAA